MWLGVVIGFALVKFSGSSRIFGFKVVMVSRSLIDIINPNISFSLK